MHVDSAENGPALRAFVHVALLVALLGPGSSACASRLPARELRAEPAPRGAAAEREAAADEPAPDQEPRPQEPVPDQQPPAAPAPVEESTAAPREKASAPEGPGWLPDWVHGSLSARYRGRSGGGDQDRDLAGVLALDVADRAHPGLSGHMLARMDVDLEGLDAGEVFEDLADTYDQAVVTKLYLLYADVALDARPEASPGTLRIGRQSDPRLPEVLRLDGVSYVSRKLGEKDVELGLYGGVPVHLYDSSSEGDRAYGTFVEGLPWHGGRARLDWMHLEDEQVLGAGKDDLFALDLWQELVPSWRFEGQYSRLESDPRDMRLNAFYTSPDTKTLVRFGYYELLETQTALVTELDPFFEQLFEYFPFRQTTLNVSQVLGAHTTIDAGFDARRVSDSDDVGEFNRDWERYYATATLSDLPAEGFGLSVTGDRWNDDLQDTSSIGADVSYAEEPWKAGVGTYYSLYKYDFLELSERDHVRTYYLRASREMSARTQLEVLYEFEDDDLDHYYTLRVGAVWRF